MKNKYYVYVLTDDKGKIFYVGKGCNSRESSHRTNAKNNRKEPVYKKIRQLWLCGVDFNLIKIKSNLDEKDAFKIEKDLIAQYKRKSDGGCLFNITAGGGGSNLYKHSAEALKKMRDAWVKRRQKNKILVSAETRKKIAIAIKGRKHSEESRKKISLSISGYKHWNYGNKGSTKATKKMNENNKKKISVNGVIFNSVSEAAAFHEIAISTAIYRANEGKNRGGKYGLWQYI